MHPDDLARLGLAADARVTVTSETGSHTVWARAFESIRPGNVLMYYPEANVLVPRHCDPASRTPAFKNVLVRVTAAVGKTAAYEAAGNGVSATDEPAAATSRGQLRAC